MPVWTPSAEWKGQDACIIGGGSSLSNFDFSQLRGRNTIGCNDAFRLGAEVVKICLFGDYTWWKVNNEELKTFRGKVATVCLTFLRDNPVDWLYTLQRAKLGLHKGGTIGWNFSTGAAAVNLALALGATRVFLLGFDMTQIQNKTHWHNHAFRSVNPSCYKRFIQGFTAIHRDLRKFPGAQVLNVTDGSSQLPHFPRIPFTTFLKYIPPQDRVPCVECEERKRLHAQEVGA